jgi:hypothetical protein
VPVVAHVDGLHWDSLLYVAPFAIFFAILIRDRVTARRRERAGEEGGPVSGAPEPADRARSKPG